MPNFERLAREGSFLPLETSFPSISPAAWSSFTTGVDASRHNIFDFLTRDPCTYSPMISSTEIGKVSRVLPLGKYRIPLGKPPIRLLRKSQPFWKLLGEHHVFSTIQRVPITFPPEKFNGVLLSGMCVPDLKGTQGTFSFYTTRKQEGAHTGGVQIAVERKGNVIESYVEGPENSLRVDHPVLKLPFKVTLDERNDEALLEVGDEKVTLTPRTYSPWLPLKFKIGLGMSVSGIARFYVMSLKPEFELYVTPIQIDPENPAMPISHPLIYSIYLAKTQGPYATLGLAEDTWALNERVIDEDAFLKQCYLIHEEREKMLMNAIEHTKRGLVTCVFDTTDRIQHMFFRYLDPTHPANAGKDTVQHKDTLADLYQRMDAMLGRIRAKIGNDPKTQLCVISDHGFTQFKRGVNLNAWLRDQGLLFLKDGKETCGDWFEAVDWSRTKAFALGLTGLFINRKGRERQGIVNEGEELVQLRKKIKDGLLALRDPKDQGQVMLSVFETDAMFDGPYKHDAPDLLIGYNHGYRHS
ncbi:MAG: alkaline phosphatase family protein, partial [Planctomycetota bacterium]